RPERYADDDSVKEAIKAKARTSYEGYLKEIDSLLAGRQWAIGEHYTVVDGYLLVFYRWGNRQKMPVTSLASSSALMQRYPARPAALVQPRRARDARTTGPIAGAHPLGGAKRRHRCRHPRDRRGDGGDTFPLPRRVPLEDRRARRRTAAARWHRPDCDPMGIAPPDGFPRGQRMPAR